MSERGTSRGTTVRRVYLIVALFIAVILSILFVVRVQMKISVSVRAYVVGEGLWAKAQKDAVHSLERYAVSHSKTDYRAFLLLIRVPLGDRKARVELQKPDPDMKIVREGFLEGGNHPDDIEPMAWFFRRFHDVSYMSRAIRNWTRGDQLIEELRGVAEALHKEITSGRVRAVTIQSLDDRLEVLNRALTKEENEFSATLSEGTRWANMVSQRLVYSIGLLFAALGVGLSWPIIIRMRATEKALSESEQKFRSITASARDAIVMMDDEGNISFWNPFAEKMFGYSGDEAMGRELHALLGPPGYYEAYRRGVEHFRETGHGAVIGKTLELAAVRKGGAEFPIEVSLSAIQIKGKWHAVGIIRAITERKKAEEDIRRLNEELESKVEQLLAAQEELVQTEKLAMLGRIAGNMGNELLNPLGVMNNAVFFLKTVLSEADETTKEYLEIFEKEIDNSRRIITDLLDFARTKPPQRQAVAAEDLVRQSLERCSIPENITVTVDTTEGLPSMNIDPLQMGQVLMNFTTNAIQAMSNGGALRIAARRVLSSEFGVLSSNLKAETLDPKPAKALTSELKFLGSNSELKTQNSQLDGDFVEISVEDTGEGISPESMKKLFQPLFTTRSRGIGLGLAISQKLTEANGGRIGVESRLGEGTTFTVALPAERGE